MEARVRRSDVRAISRPAERRRREGLSVSGWSWALYEGARDPYLILIAIYVFMPYFVTVVVGDPVRGQALVAGFGKVAGLIVAFTAPFLGLIVDRLGRRKPMLLALTVLMAGLLASLWWARPDGTGLSIQAIVLIATALNVTFVYSQVVHNALLVQAAGPTQAGQASGTALFLANVLGIASLAGVLWAFVLPGRMELPLSPSAPLLGLDPQLHEPDRVVAWVAAGLLMVGSAPLFLLSRDAPATGARLGDTLRAAGPAMLAMFRSLRGRRNVAVFLMARVFYADAIGAMALFLGIYAAGVMGWTTLPMLAFAIGQCVFAGTGGFIAGRLDTWLGPKRALLIELTGALVATAGMIGMAPDRILYLWDYAPGGWSVSTGPLHITLPTAVFLLCAGGVTLWATAASGSSRTMLVSITPKEESGAFFGLFALAGAATAWLGPLLVELFTRWFGSQQVGFAPVAALLVAGLFGVMAVDARRPPRLT